MSFVFFSFAAREEHRACEDNCCQKRQKSLCFHVNYFMFNIDKPFQPYGKLQVFFFFFFATGGISYLDFD